MPCPPCQRIGSRLSPCSHETHCSSACVSILSVNGIPLCDSFAMSLTRPRALNLTVSSGGCPLPGMHARRAPTARPGDWVTLCRSLHSGSWMAGAGGGQLDQSVRVSGDSDQNGDHPCVRLGGVPTRPGPNRRGPSGAGQISGPRVTGSRRVGKSRLPARGAPPPLKHAQRGPYPRFSAPD